MWYMPYHALGFLPRMLRKTCGLNQAKWYLTSNLFYVVTYKILYNSQNKWVKVSHIYYFPVENISFALLRILLKEIRDVCT